MSEFIRFAIYYLPEPGPLADFGAAWLGWDVLQGNAVAQPDVPEIVAMTKPPRKYGFHATMKAPFALNTGKAQSELETALEAFCAVQPQVQLDALALGRLGRFLALVPMGDTASLCTLAADCVQQFDPFRLPLQEADLTRRRAAGLSAVQDSHLLRWGYPYVLDQFRFHMTLTGGLDDARLGLAQAHLQQSLPPLLPTPFVIDRIALVGQRTDGFFEQIHAFVLTG